MEAERLDICAANRRVNMKYYLIEPEVAGGIGEHSVIDRSSGKMIVRKLHYVFEDWGGDVVLTSCPCLIVTESAKRKLQSVGLTGLRFDEVEITTSELFDELYPNRLPPELAWLQTVGKPGHDGLGIAIENTRFPVNHYLPVFSPQSLRYRKARLAASSAFCE